jgi:hypothetical protein
MMTQWELDGAVARATGESISVIADRGFQLADPLNVDFDPEPRGPLVYDWDREQPVELPYCGSRTVFL